MRFITGKLGLECFNKWQSRWISSSRMLIVQMFLFILVLFLGCIFYPANTLASSVNVSWHFIVWLWKPEMFNLYTFILSFIFLPVFFPYVLEGTGVWRFIFNFVLNIWENLRYCVWYLPVQVCDQCANVKYVREGYFVTVDIEKGMKDGQVNF